MVLGNFTECLIGISRQTHALSATGPILLFFLREKYPHHNSPLWPFMPSIPPCHPQITRRFIPLSFLLFLGPSGGSWSSVCASGRCYLIQVDHPLHCPLFF